MKAESSLRVVSYPQSPTRLCRCLPAPKIAGIVQAYLLLDAGQRGEIVSRTGVVERHGTGQIWQPHRIKTLHF